MRLLKNIIVNALIGVLLGILACTVLLMSPFLMAMYILGWAVKFEDDMMTETVYVNEDGIEWGNVMP